MRMQSQPDAVLASCNPKPEAATLKVYLNVQQSSAERLQRTLCSSPCQPRIARFQIAKEKT